MTMKAGVLTPRYEASKLDEASVVPSEVFGRNSHIPFVNLPVLSNLEIQNCFPVALVSGSHFLVSWVCRGAQVFGFFGRWTPSTEAVGIISYIFNVWFAVQFAHGIWTLFHELFVRGCQTGVFIVFCGIFLARRRAHVWPSTAHSFDCVLLESPGVGASAQALTH